MTMYTERNTFDDPSQLKEPGGPKNEISLTIADRFNIERFLGFAENGGIIYSDTLLALLRQKLRLAREAPHPAPAHLATFGRRVVYQLDKADPADGILSFGIVCHAGEIPVHSTLGATIIGMKTGQKAIVDTDEGVIRTLVLLDVADPSCHLRIDA